MLRYKSLCGLLQPADTLLHIKHPLQNETVFASRIGCRGSFREPLGCGRGPDSRCGLRVAIRLYLHGHWWGVWGCDLRRYPFPFVHRRDPVVSRDRQDDQRMQSPGLANTQTVGNILGGSRCGDEENSSVWGCLEIIGGEFGLYFSYKCIVIFRIHTYYGKDHDRFYRCSGGR